MLRIRAIERSNTCADSKVSMRVTMLGCCTSDKFAISVWISCASFSVSFDFAITFTAYSFRDFFSMHCALLP